jgi:hypothetical protein
VETGTLAEWFAAVGTVGTFAIGLRLLGRDRRVAVRAQAERVVIWFENDHHVIAANRSAGRVYEAAHTA